MIDHLARCCRLSAAVIHYRTSIGQWISGKTRVIRRIRDAEDIFGKNGLRK